jgi:hypothetical protein
MIPSSEDAKEGSDLAGRKVRFFSVSLRNGIVVSTPSYPDKQAFCAHLIRSIEEANPDFAWVQFLFVRSNLAADLVRLMNSIHRAKRAIERLGIDVVSGQEAERRELHRDYYRQSDVRVKKADELVARPTITLAVQGMWVSRKEQSPAGVLPFDHCSDEHDSLAVFQYRDPRMLLELVDRRMVVDISGYLERFTRSRMEPPSFIVTPAELQSYVHLPAGEVAQSLTSLKGGCSTRGCALGMVGGEDTTDGRNEISSRLVKLEEVPRMEKALEDVSVQPLAHLAVSTVRTFELVYRDGKTNVLLSAETIEEMRRYAGLLSTVYGGLKFQTCEPCPAYLHRLPKMVGLGPADKNGR